MCSRFDTSVLYAHGRTDKIFVAQTLLKGSPNNYQLQNFYPFSRRRQRCFTWIISVESVGSAVEGGWKMSSEGDGDGSQYEQCQRENSIHGDVAGCPCCLQTITADELNWTERTIYLYDTYLAFIYRRQDVLTTATDDSRPASWLWPP